MDPKELWKLQVGQFAVPSGNGDEEPPWAEVPPTTPATGTSGGGAAPAAANEPLEYRVIVTVTYPAGYKFDGSFRSQGKPLPVRRLERHRDGTATQYYEQSYKVEIPAEEKCRYITAAVSQASFQFESPDGHKEDLSLTNERDRRLQGPRPASASRVICKGRVEEFQFDYTYNPKGPGCKGWYYARLVVHTTGGQISETQMKRVGESASKTSSTGYSGPDMYRSGDQFVFTWPKVEKECGGPYPVTVKLNTNLAISPSYHSGSVTVEPKQTSVVQFQALLDLSGGGGQPPQKPDLKGAEKATSPEPEGRSGQTAATRTPYAEEGMAYPEESASPWDEGDAGLEVREAPGFEQEDLSEELHRSGMAYVDPQAAAMGHGLSAPAPIGSAPDAPWTLLDMRVDPNASMDVRDAIDLHDIQGQSIVRGHFNGRFRGFVQGPGL